MTMRRGVRMPVVERLIQRTPAGAPVKAPAPRPIEPIKAAPTGYQWPERGAIDTLFREAKKIK